MEGPGSRHLGPRLGGGGEAVDLGASGGQAPHPPGLFGRRAAPGHLRSGSGRRPGLGRRRGSAQGKLLPDPSKITDSWRNAEFTRDGRTLVVGRTDGQAEVWDLAESRLTRMIKIHPGGVGYVQPSPDGRLLASMVVTLDFPPFLSKARVLLGALLPGWSRTDQEVALFDLATGQELARFPGASDVEFSPDGRTIVTREWDGTFSVRDAPRPLGR